MKNHIIQGYSINKKRLAEQGLQELEQTVKLLHKTLVTHEHIDEIGSETIQLIISYAKTWRILLAYDEDNLATPTPIPTTGKSSTKQLDYNIAKNAITSLRLNLASRNESTQLFGNERDEGLKSILNNIEQTFGGEELYKTAEEKAANLLYFIIKDHPFTDGNKRISCLIFLLYLRLQNISIKFNQNGLIALALLIAESDASQKDIMVKLTTNLLIDY